MESNLDKSDIVYHVINVWIMIIHCILYSCIVYPRPIQTLDNLLMGASLLANLLRRVSYLRPDESLMYVDCGQDLATHAFLVYDFPSVVSCSISTF